ncbi:MAG: hypothetical protein KDK51_08045 [Deltaproteobacteria bacterium]|nr:hypothetical protein [Deltaproteobacteria bacterium]
MKLLHFLSMISVMVLLSCGGDTSGSIDITLDISALSASEQANIGHFIFIVSSVGDGGATSVLYPSACLSSNAGNACIEPTICGFAADQASFDPNVAFDDFAKDSTISVTLCALDSTSGYIGAGTVDVVNADGESATITVNTTNVCTGLPAVCP